MTTAPRFLTLLAPLTLLLACRAESDRLPSELSASDRSPSGFSASSFANSEWSTPVNLGPVVNSTVNDIQPSLSHDGLSLYFASVRAGGVGANDIWVTRRACDGCPWETPVNVAPLNTSFLEGGPALSRDGHLLFFHSGRPGGPGSNDIYVSRRANPTDDFGWESPTLLGPDVNTATLENRPFYQQSAEDGAGNLYFNRGPAAGVLNDIYVAAVTRDGEVRGPAVLVAELSDPSASDMSAAVRDDGREVFFASNRAGTLGPTDIWVSTRRSVHDPWSPPVNLGLPVNSAFGDQTNSLSTDGRTLLFDSDRPGGVGLRDIWISTRTPSGH